MESHAGLVRAEKEKKADLKRQIALLQAQVGDMPDSDPESEPSPKRPKLNHHVLAPATPSPKKKRPEKLHVPKSSNVTPASLKNPTNEFVPVKPAASNVLRNLANTRRAPLEAAVEVEPLARSAAFTDTPATAPEPVVSGSTAPRRDDRLAIMENLEMGPMDHKPSFDDPLFKQLEPNSGIRLSSRVLDHEDLQDHLRGRYYLSPSRLYSAVRLLPDKQGYDVPVDGDWITIAVVAERGPYKYSKPPVTITRDEEDESGKGKGKGKTKAKEPPKPSGKKYINMKLVDFGAPARSASSATGGKAVIRGDAMLSLLLFESDGFDTIPQDEGQPRKVYRGGSRGAFEEMCDLKEGDVVALLNPRILKPFQRATDAPHPTTNILAITPESASSILVIGRSKDLGLCCAIKRDGKVCGSWCDKRLSDVCEWHVQNAVEQRRAGRSEFSSGTSGMSTTARKRRNPADEYDPRRKWGLQPVNQHDPNSGTTYVLSGHIVGGAESTSVADNIGREGQAKASRKRAEREEKVLLKLLGRDKEGMRDVVKAREVGLELAGGGKEKGGGTGNKKEKETSTGSKAPPPPPTKNAFSAEIVKQLGFDPTLKPGQKRRPENPVTRKKMDELTRLQNSRTEISLKNRRPPGERIRSGVIVPPALKKASATTTTAGSRMVCLDSDSDDDLPLSVPLPMKSR